MFFLSFVLLEGSSVFVSAGENNSSLSETLDHRKPRRAESSLTSMTREEQSQAKFRPRHDFKAPLFSPCSPSPEEDFNTSQSTSVPQVSCKSQSWYSYQKRLFHLKILSGGANCTLDSRLEPVGYTLPTVMKSPDLLII